MSDPTEPNNLPDDVLGRLLAIDRAGGLGSEAHAVIRDAVAEIERLRGRPGAPALVATCPVPVVSMIVFRDRLFVALSNGVFERGADGVFREVKFEAEP